MPQPVLPSLGKRIASQHGVAVVPVPVQLVGVPVGVGRPLADKFVGAVAHHVAHGGIHVDDAAFQVAGAHAHQQRVFHGLAEGLGLLQRVGALLHALLQPDAGLAVFGQAALAQLPVQRTQHQQTRGQRGQRPGLLARHGHHPAVGRDGECPAQVGKGFLERQVPLAIAVQAQFGAGLVALLAQDPGHGAGCPAGAVLFVVLQLLHVGGGHGAAGAVEPAGLGAQEHDAARVRHEHRVAQLLPGVGDGLHAHFHGHHTNHPAVVVHGGRHKQAGLARGLAHAVKAPGVTAQCIVKVGAVAVVLVHKAARRVPVA